MELTRRDVLAALAVVGVAGGAGGLETADSGSDTGWLSDHEVATLVAVAEVAYPSEVSEIESFVRQYSLARVNDDSEYGAGVRDAIRTLDDATTDWFSGRFVSLDEDIRNTALEQIGAVAAAPDPEGLRGARIRYYLLNELLYAFYTTPTGASLVGLENPPGYPGGDTSYQHGPPHSLDSRGSQGRQS